ncbi:peptidylprolyl isomerase [Paenibacillus wynnii]|uniref:Foldase protein PrsA n=1 Tax=Paenibacillus wynnii TaxID=268407 RepID=A0A098M5D2_9BACL|nr:peptidylprolyl isomerase [Paenibacillus wynnii]KGE16752.1 peptidylprolyl isomerase [Paenibacillus wynnii]
MDKKDYKENEHLDNNGTTEEHNASDNEIEGPLAEETSPVVEEVITSEPPVAAEIEESVPVMSKVGSAPAIVESSPKSNKGWMIASLILAAALIVVLIKPPFQKADGESAVATVNGTNITKDQLYAKLVEAGGENTLKSMITTTIVELEAKKANVPAVTDADINAEIEDLKTQFGGEAALNSALSQSGMTIDDLKKQMPIQVQLRKILEPQIKITDDEVKKYYEDNKATYDTVEQVRASHILVATQAEADAILKQLKDGADFAALAQEKSTDTGSKDNGGDLDFFNREAMDPSFADAAFKLKVGETSGAVKSQFGFHIIKVTDRKEAHTSTFEEKKEEVRKTLVTQKVSEMSATWLEETTAKAKITNTLTDPKDDAAATDAPAASEAPAKE